MERNNDDLWKMLQNTAEWLRFAELKAGIVFTVQSGIVSFGLPLLLTHREAILGNQLLLGLVIASACFSILAIYCALRCVAPRLRPIKGRSVLYFGDVATTFASANVFEEVLDGYRESPTGLNKHIVQQIWANSVIAAHKFRLCGFGLWFLAFGMACECLIALVAFVS